MDIELVIIGAGISGISMARAAQKKGIKYVILESSNKWGGVWNSAFECTRLQTHWKNYGFQDLNANSSIIKSNFPFSGEILEYLNTYTNKYLLNCIFNKKVKKCYFDNFNCIWNITIETGEVYTSKYLSVCSGYYNNPRELVGLSRFEGEIINYNKYSKIRLKNKKILIVGNGASCVDVLKHWQKTGILEEIKTLDISYNRDKYFLNTYFANFISLFVNKYFLRFLSIIPRKLLIILIYLFCEFNGHIPKEKFSADNVVASGIITNLEKSGRIKYIKSLIACAKGNKVLFANGNVGDYDIIINKCGYKKSIDFMNIDDIDKELGYNYCLVDRFPQCAFIGFAPSANWTRVSEAQSKWWSCVITGSIKMPTKYECKQFIFKKGKTKGDTRVFNDLTYESLDFADKLSRDCNL